MSLQKCLCLIDPGTFHLLNPPCSNLSSGPLSHTAAGQADVVEKEVGHTNITYPRAPGSLGHCTPDTLSQTCQLTSCLCFSFFFALYCIWLSEWQALSISLWSVSLPVLWPVSLLPGGMLVLGEGRPLAGIKMGYQELSQARSLHHKWEVHI